MGQNGNGLKTATAQKLNGNGTGTERNYPSRCTDGRWEFFFMPTVYNTYVHIRNYLYLEFVNCVELFLFIFIYYVLKVLDLTRKSVQKLSGCTYMYYTVIITSNHNYINYHHKLHTAINTHSHHHKPNTIHIHVHTMYYVLYTHTHRQPPMTIW